jgi:HEAT repeat protein
VAAVAELEEDIIAHLADEDHFVRAEAAHALGSIDSPRARQALQAAQRDRSVAVQEAAEQALITILNRPQNTPLPLLDPIDLGEITSQGQMS